MTFPLKRGKKDFLSHRNQTAMAKKDPRAANRNLLRPLIYQHPQSPPFGKMAGIQMRMNFLILEGL